MCVVVCVELFCDVGEIMISFMINMVLVGVWLVWFIFVLDILLIDGEV